MSITLNKAAEALFSGDILNASTVGSVLAEVLAETVGPSGIAVEHFNKGQGKWPGLSASWLADKRKRASGGKKFYLTGSVYRAISLTPAAGKMREFGSSSDIYSMPRAMKKRFVAGGLYVVGSVSATRASMTVGFNGTFKHSAGFSKARREEALSRGANLKGKAGRNRAYAVRQAASISQAAARLDSINAERKAKGQKSLRKFAAKGSLGIARKGVDSLTAAGTALARGNDNLAHANLLQRGVHKGIKKTLGGVLDQQHVGNLRRRGKTVNGTAVSGKAMPLLPYEAGDERRIAAAIERGLSKVFAAVDKAA